MEAHTKDRIIGLGVLAFTVAISLPWFIEHLQGNTEFSEPVWPEMALNTPTEETQIIEEKIAAHIASAPAATPIPDEAPATIEHALPEPTRSFTIQLATFTKEKNAQELENKLRTAGFSAYSVRTNGKNGPLIKVLVGPHVKKADAEKVQSNIESKFQLKGFVVGYDPVNT